MGKRLFDKVYQKRDPVIKYIGKPVVVDSKVTKSSSLVPKTVSASSVEASEFNRYWRSVRNSLLDTHKSSDIPRTASNPPLKKFLRTFYKRFCLMTQFLYIGLTMILRLKLRKL